MAEFDGVDCCMKVAVIEYRCGVVVRDECGTPDAEESVDDVI